MLCAFVSVLEGLLPRQDSSTSHLSSAWGFLLVLALLFVNLRLPSYTVDTDFQKCLLPAGQLMAQGHAAALYEELETAPPRHAAPNWVPEASQGSFMDFPLAAVPFALLSHLDGHVAQIVWLVLSLLALSYCPFVMARAAAVLEMTGEHTGLLAWGALSFAPALLTLWEGQTGIVYGLLPLSLGFYLAIKKKFGLAGLLWSLTLLRPIFLVAPLFTCLVEALRGKFRGLMGLVTGIALQFLLAFFVCGGNTLQAWWQSLPRFVFKPNWQADLNISFSHSILQHISVEHHELLYPLLVCIGLIAAIAGYNQVKKLKERDGKEWAVLPFSFLVGTCVTPLLVPQLAYYDLSIYLMAAWIVLCWDWREHMEWRLISSMRVHWIFVNAYLLLYIMEPSFAYPIILIALLLILYRRLIETVQFVAATPNLEFMDI